MNAATQTVMTCPGCSNTGELTDDPQVLKCTGCGGVFTTDTPIQLGQAFRFVALGQPMLQNAGSEGQFYFDLVVVGWSNYPGYVPGRIIRAHGWADRKTKRVVQWG